MYRCEVCRTVSRAGQSELRHIIFKSVTRSRMIGNEHRQVLVPQIEREIRVCHRCKSSLDEDPSCLARLIKEFAEKPKPMPLSPIANANRLVEVANQGESVSGLE